MAKWALARRVDGLTDAEIGEAFASGRFLRTHVLRPTWHIVRPADLGWIMRLTAPRVRRILASTNKANVLSEAELPRAVDVVVATLSARQPQTRSQLAAHLADAGIEVAGTRLANLMMYAELELLICNGPMIGKQHSYLLAPASVTSPAPLTEDEALARLARTYVRGHGPSRPADLAWWSSLTLTQARKAFALADLRPVTIEGAEFFTDQTSIEADLPAAALISPFDESISYVAKPVDPVRYRDTSPDLARGSGLLFLDGIIGGTWSRKQRTTSVEITVAGFRRLSGLQRRGVERDADRFGAFLGLDHDLRIIA